MATLYTVKKKRSAYVLFRCSYCDQIALQKVMMTAQSGYDDRGSGLGRNYRDNMEERARLADGNADDVMDTYLADLRENKSAKVYLKTKFRCSCPHCGKREPWARMNVTWLFWLAVVGFIAMASFALYHINIGMYIGLGVGVASLVLLFGWKYLMLMLTAKRIQKCPPLFEEDLQELKHRGLRNRWYADMDWDALMMQLGKQTGNE